jgi:hypothetical protein
LAPGGVRAEPIQTGDDELADEAALARFRAPGSRSSSPMPASTEPAVPVARPVYPLEPPAPEKPSLEPLLDPAARAPDDHGAADQDEPAEDEPAATHEPQHALADDEHPEEQAEAAPDEPAAEASDAPAEAAQPEPEPAEPVIIDLDEQEAAWRSAEAVAAAQEAAWRQVVLEPEPDSVDHVLQALINRARFKQVAVEEVATELVERADLRGEDVSGVLAELVGRTSGESRGGRSSELMLFNDEVPSRPGQLTDFDKLKPSDKKRIIIRVLCLLVARSEDQQLPPRADAEVNEDTSEGWPVARAVWPLGDAEEEGSLPNRRLATSG